MAGTIFLVNKMGDLSSYVKGSLSIIAISGAIALSSVLISMGDYSTYPSVEWALNAGLSLAMFGAGAVLLGLESVIPTFWPGLVAIPVTALAITATSHILALGNYGKYPSVDWSLGVGLSLAAFGTGAAILGSVIATGIGAIAIAAGLLTIPLISGAIVLSDSILSEGTYSKYPNINWILGVSAALTSFSSGLTILGILPKIVVRDGIKAILDISDSIVTIGGKFSKSVFTGGPTEEWARGISIALGAFSPIYSMLIKDGIMKIFGSGISIDDFSKAIKTISSGIVDSANLFAGSSVSFKKGPTEEWAKGVGLALGSFSPIYSMLVKNGVMSIFGGGGIGPDDFSKAITSVSMGIITSASIFSTFKSSFVDAPPESWARGVGGALGAFSPVFDIISKTSGLFGGVTGKDLMEAISTVSMGIVQSGFIFSGTKSNFDIGSVPKVEWSKLVSAAVISFYPIFDFVSKNSGWFGSDSGDVKDAILDIADSIKEFSVRIAEGNYTKSIPISFLSGITTTVYMFSDINKKLEGLDIDDGIDNIQDIIDGIKSISESSSDIKFKSIDTKSMEVLSKSIISFSGFLSTINKSINIKSLSTSEDRIRRISEIVDESFDAMSSIKIRKVDYTSIKSILETVSNIVKSINIPQKDISLILLFGLSVGKITDVINNTFEQMSSIKVKKIDSLSINTLSNSLSVISESILSASKIDVGAIDLSKMVKVLTDMSSDLSNLSSGLVMPDMSWIGPSLNKISNIDFDPSKLRTIISSINELSKETYNKFPLMDWSNGFETSVGKIKSSSDIINDLGSINGEFTNLNKISDAFDILTKSVEEFSNSISNIDSSKISSSLSSLSGSSIVVKLANDDKINELIKIFDDSSNKIVDAINTYNIEKSGGDGLDEKSVVISKPKPTENEEFKKLSEKVDLMTSLLGDIASVVGSRGALKNYILSIQNDISIGKK